MNFRRTCANCDVPTNNPRFCNSSCAAIYNNKERIRTPWKGYARKIYSCPKCGKILDRYRVKSCRDCRRRDFESVTLADLKKSGSRNAYDTVVRSHARSVALRAGLLKKCAICGYNLYVDCCHLTPVCEFAESTTLGIVNRPNNLVGLCRNHHWELDHDKLVRMVGVEPTTKCL